tara:strand:+ start:1041 stop:2282 length:1242 start_codon:yes stop_codon:yes gene_type:complete
MAVSPDLLLNIKAPTAVAKSAGASPKPAPQSSRDEASSFANVYAKERQGKPAEAQGASAKPVRNKAADDKPSQETDKASGVEKPAANETGNDLPANLETVDDSAPTAEAELDPLLLFGMGGQGEVSTEAVVEEPPLTGSEFLVGLAQPQAVAEGVPADGEAVLTGQRTLDIQSTVQKSPLVASLAPAEEPTLDAQEAVSTSLLGEKLVDEAAESSPEEGFAELLEQLEAPKESRTSASEAAINRLNPLTQAIAQQNQMQQILKPPMVPGQPVQMQQSGWSEAVVDRVMWLSSQNLKSAEIQLDPAELGRMEVRIDMTKDQTQVTFLSPHAGVRDALEGQMQRLRDMFTQQGMTMDVNVSDQSRGWRGDGSGGESRDRGIAGVSAAGEDEVVQGSMEISSARAGGDRGLVDYYA